MLQALKQTLLTRGPFAQAHMGYWIRSSAFKHYFEKEIRGRSIRRVLDAGCGDGAYAIDIARRMPESEVVGMDILRSPAWDERRLANLSFSQRDLHQLDEHETFDLVVSVDSLEHMKDNRLVMRAFWRALRPGGLLYLAMPLDKHDRSFLPARWYAFHKDWADDEHIGEQYELDQLAGVLREMGFSIRLARHTFTVWGRLSWELQTALHRGPVLSKLRTLGIPLFKLLGLMDIHAPIGEGHNLIIAEKPKA